MLEIMAVELAIKTFVRSPRARNMMIDNISALTYLIKMGGTKCVPLMEKTKEIWDFLLSKGIMVTAEYLPTDLNVEADAESRDVMDWSEWKLDTHVFNQICWTLGHPTVDLFASRTSHLLQDYMSLKPDPQCIAVDALSQPWGEELMYAFPPFNLIGKVLRKVKRERATIILIAPVWITQPWYPLLLDLAMTTPRLLPKETKLLSCPEGVDHPLLVNNTLQLSAWVVSGQAETVKTFQRGLETFWSTHEHREPDAITTQPGRNLVAGVVGEKLIPFHVL
jgi:hypothetical protein